MPGQHTYDFFAIPAVVSIICENRPDQQKSANYDVIMYSVCEGGGESRQSWILTNSFLTEICDYTCCIFFGRFWCLLPLEYNTGQIYVKSWKWPDSGQIWPAIFRPWECVNKKNFNTKIPGKYPPLWSPWRKNTTTSNIQRWWTYDTVSTHERLLSRSKTFFPFKGPVTFKKNLNRRQCWGLRGLSIDTTHTRHCQF